MATFSFLFAVPAYAVYIGISYVLLVAGYRLLLHPLRSYPGPIVARLSNIYAGVHAYRRCLHLHTLNNHQKYGPVIRQGPNRLLFNSVKAYRDIYQNERVTKADSYLVTQQTANAFNVFNAIDRDVHRSKRKLVGQVVTERSMRTFEPIMAEQIDTFLKQLLTSNSRPVNMTEKARYLSLDVVGLLAFGYRLQLQTNESNRFMAPTMYLGNYLINIYMQFPLAIMVRVRRFINLLLFRGREQYFHLLETMIHSRATENVHAQHDFYSFVAERLEPEPGLRMGDLWTEALFFMIAGGDTTATALSAVFFYLSRNPECYRKLSQEIRSTFTEGSEIHSGQLLAKCQYLRACIDESLRMSPPLPSTLWRQLAPDDNESHSFVVDGHVIPKGVEVGVNIYSLHHNPEYFPEPFNFRPERWLPPSDTESEHSWASFKTARDAFATFSVGSRGCAGKAMAYLEISLVLAKTSWYFDFRSAEGKLGKLGGGSKGEGLGRERPDEYQLFDINSAAHDGPYLTFQPRGDFCWEELGVEKREQ